MEALAKEQPKKQPKLIVSIGPHMHDEESTAKIMWTVSGALLPATLMSVYYFGLRAVWVIVVSIIAAVLSEAAGQKMLKKPVTIADGSAFLTGLLIALNVRRSGFQHLQPRAYRPGVHPHKLPQAHDDVL